ncbi:MAG: lipopolysaccharide biosynthesis protein [Armatimonadota bacterium]
MARLTQQVAIIGTGRLLTTAIAAGTMMVLARIMPDKESYGTVLQLLMLYMLFSQVFSIGLPQSVNYFMPRYQGGEQRGFLTQVVVLLMAAGALLGAGLYLGAEHIGFLLKSPRLPELLHIFACYPLFMLPTLLVENTMLFHNRPLTAVTFNLIVRLGMFCSLVIPIWLGFHLARSIGIWMVSAAVMSVIALIIIFSTVRRLPFIWHRRMLVETGKFSLPLAAVTLINLCSVYLDRIIVSALFGAVAFGVYSNGTLEVPTVTMVTNATALVLFAEFSRQTAAHGNTAILATWHRASAKTGILILASFGFLVFWAHETIELLFSSRFADSGDIFSIFIWFIPVELFTLRPLYLASGASLHLTALSLIDLVNNGLWMWGLGHLWGLKGVVLGRVIAAVVILIIGVTIYVRHITKIGWKAFMPWKTLGLTLVIALAAGGMSRILHFLLPPAWPLIVTFGLALVLYLFCYGLALYFTHLIELVVPARYLHWRARANSAAPPLEEQHVEE